MCIVAKSTITSFPELFEETGWVKVDDLSIAMRKGAEAHQSLENQKTGEAGAGDKQEKEKKEYGPHSFPELLHFLLENKHVIAG
jgi:hypothetical protein